MDEREEQEPNEEEREFLVAPDDEVPSGQHLKMIDEGGVHGCTTNRAQHRNRLGGDFLRDHHPEPGCDLGQQSRDGRGALVDNPASSHLLHRPADRSRHRGTNRKVPAFVEIVRAGVPAKGKHL